MGVGYPKLRSANRVKAPQPTQSLKDYDCPLSNRLYAIRRGMAQVKALEEALEAKKNRRSGGKDG
jgi:hypothetical protein